MKSSKLIGVVAKKKMDKTVVVKITRMIKHKKYQKYIKKTTKYFIHDENNSCKEGDVITFKKTAPISKKKHWAIISKIEKG